MSDKIFLFKGMFFLKQYFVFAVSVIVALFAFEAITLASSSSMTDILCGGYNVFRGPMGKMLAVFAIVALGVGLFMGKITWGLVFAVALGVGAIFGAPTIVGVITGDGSADLCQEASNARV